MKQKTTHNHNSRVTRGLAPLLLLIAFTTQAQNTDTTDQGVVINGITWATRNVDAPGTFAKTPESAGMFYQWNRRTAWSATDSIVTGWDNTFPEGAEWEKANDPCPQNWRVPTKEELRTFFDEEKVITEWITQNGINGRTFTNKATGHILFFPAVGYRTNYSGTLYSAGTYGSYWSSTQHDSFNACYLYFDSDNSRVDGIIYARAYGFPVRCVKE